MNVAPRGLPRWRRRDWDCDVEDVVVCVGVEEVWEVSGEDKLVFKRKSCVIAMPIEAKEREVRSQARNVLSKMSSVSGLLPHHYYSSYFS